ncbi:hypothetical protein CHS0354_032352 [Potamilus streckersoni]|uniref:Chitin-binding type-2 domain-containing protein n=1 Tax=Potamilus streckersoni TaxID=2493646 RepID=A0AAE0WCV1_9BIVA|nr:hypothetical protein CHS0354_032352 [Potamilus streckersoni]
MTAKMKMFYTIISKFLTLAFCSIAVANNICQDSLFMEWKKDSTDCSVFYLCVGETAVKYTCPVNTVADVKERACVPKKSAADECATSAFEQTDGELHIREQDTVHECKTGDTESHDKGCAKYFECIKAENGSRVMKEQECPYPMLYDVTSGKCNDYQNVKCENRPEPKNPCEYEANQCKGAMCTPCYVRYPSCAEQPNGKNPWIGREWSPYYIICENGRVTLQGQCPHGDTGYQIFDPYSKECVEFYLNNRAN